MNLFLKIFTLNQEFLIFNLVNLKLKYFERKSRIQLNLSCNAYSHNLNIYKSKLNRFGKYLT